MGTRCAACGAETIGRALCPHHSAGYADDWAAGNRVMCDFIHRGIIVAMPDDAALLEAA